MFALQPPKRRSPNPSKIFVSSRSLPSWRFVGIHFLDGRGTSTQWNGYADTNLHSDDKPILSGKMAGEGRSATDNELWNEHRLRNPIPHPTCSSPFLLAYCHQIATETRTTVYANGLQVAKMVGSTTTYLYENHIGSIQFVSSSTGSQLFSSNYVPYGPQYGASGTPDEFLYAGKIYDGSTGFYYFGARFYDHLVRLIRAPKGLFTNLSKFCAHLLAESNPTTTSRRSCRARIALRQDAAIRYSRRASLRFPRSHEQSSSHCNRRHPRPRFRP